VTTSICEPVCVSDSVVGETVRAFGASVGDDVGDGVGDGVAPAVAVALGDGVADGVTEAVESLAAGGTAFGPQAVSARHTATRSCFVMMHRVYGPNIPATFRASARRSMRLSGRVTVIAPQCTGMSGEKCDQIDEFGEVATLLRRQVHDAAAPRERRLLGRIRFEPEANQKRLSPPCHRAGA
jgi:hypothetical protein